MQQDPHTLNAISAKFLPGLTAGGGMVCRCCCRRVCGPSWCSWATTASSSCPCSTAWPASCSSSPPGSTSPWVRLSQCRFQVIREAQCLCPGSFRLQLLSSWFNITLGAPLGRSCQAPSIFIIERCGSAATFFQAVIHCNISPSYQSTPAQRPGLPPAAPLYLVQHHPGCAFLNVVFRLRPRACAWAPLGCSSSLPGCACAFLPNFWKPGCEPSGLQDVRYRPYKSETSGQAARREQVSQHALGTFPA